MFCYVVLRMDVGGYHCHRAMLSDGDMTFCYVHTNCKDYFVSFICYLSY